MYEPRDPDTHFRVVFHEVAKVRQWRSPTLTATLLAARWRTASDDATCEAPGAPGYAAGSLDCCIGRCPLPAAGGTAPWSGTAATNRRQFYWRRQHLILNCSNSPKKTFRQESQIHNLIKFGWRKTIPYRNMAARFDTMKNKAPKARIKQFSSPIHRLQLGPYLLSFSLFHDRSGFAYISCTCANFQVVSERKCIHFKCPTCSLHV